MAILEILLLCKKENRDHSPNLRRAPNPQSFQDGWSWSWFSAIDSNRQTIWIAEAHRGCGKRFIVRAENSLFACPHVMSAVRVSSLFSSPSWLPRC